MSRRGALEHGNKMAKGIREKLKAACAEAGLPPALGRDLVERVMGPGGAKPGGRGKAERLREEAELANLREEIARMSAAEEEMKMLLGVASRESIVPALENVLEKLKTLKVVAGFDGPQAGPA